MLTMLQLNNKVENTDMFYNFRKDACDSYKRNMQKAHLLIEGNYSVLFGNGLEMLKATIKDKEHPMAFSGVSVLGIDVVHNINFKYNVPLLGCRSPHVTMSNLYLCKNVECRAIDTYFNLSKQILCVNSIKNNILERANSCDFDSDAMLVTDSEQIILAVKKNYNNFLVPTNLTVAQKTNRKNTWEDKADLDVKTSVNKIGEIINLSQELNTKIWHMINTGLEAKSIEVQNVFTDVCQLAIMSCIEIDSAKKEFSINISKELEILRNKYKETELVKETIIQKTLKDGTVKENKTHEVAEDSIKELYQEMILLKKDGQDYKYFMKKYNLQDYKEMKIRPYFMQYMMDKKYLENYIFQPYHTSMDYIETIIEKKYRKDKIKRRDSLDKGFSTFTQMFTLGSEIKMKNANKKQIDVIVNGVYNLKNETSKIWNNENLENTEKYKRANDLKNNYIKEISKMKVNAETIKKIIKNLDEAQQLKRKNKGAEIIECELTGIARKLLSILFKSHTTEFIRIFAEHKEDIPKLRLVHKNDDIIGKEIIKIYNLEYIAN
ncbi:hypothetical protein [Clostridium lacusfryxellense]|uniref:hypothetical protein n=1 Tax=Clostridium lacusfryxellense TaxID=205328 RepID=UPI001C0DEB45|nr:hypothetical protein [Clostridium lacusfryxellense]MBU3112141.1 hypothetical protein [Clostridium lacusfryxellense]